MQFRKGDKEAIAKVGEVISDKIEQELEWLIGILSFVGFSAEVDNLKQAQEKVKSTRSLLAMCQDKRN